MSQVAPATESQDSTPGIFQGQGKTAAPKKGRNVNPWDEPAVAAPRVVNFGEALATDLPGERREPTGATSPSSSSPSSPSSAESSFAVPTGSPEETGTAGSSTVRLPCPVTLFLASTVVDALIPHILDVCLSVCPSVCLSVWLSVCLSGLCL